MKDGKPMVRILRLPSNDAGRDLVVGDLHGQTDLLRRLKSEVGFAAGADRLFFCGDLVDRGDGCVEALLELAEPWAFSVQGNHEEIFVAAAKNGFSGAAAGFWMDTDGKWARGLSPGVYGKLAETAAGLPHVIVVGEGDRRFHVVHGQLVPKGGVTASDGWLDVTLAGKGRREDIAGMLWGRGLYSSGKAAASRAQSRHLSKTYCGHTIVGSPEVVGRQAFIDTGAFMERGGLTAVDSATDEWVTVRRGRVDRGRLAW